MYNRQLHPLEVNPSTGEVFLRLKSHKNIILTPPRLSDIPLTLPILNDPAVCFWLKGPPYPYTLEHSESWIKLTTESSQRVLLDLDTAADDDPLKIVDASPVRSIRELKEDGTDIFLGDIAITRCPWMDLAIQDGSGTQTNAELVKLNESRAPGDPEIIWTIGDYLAPSHHGRGIMSDALATLLNDWAIPRMGIRKMVGTTFSENHGSRRVFEKNGFVLRTVVKDHIEVKGTMRSINILDWVPDQ